MSQSSNYWAQALQGSPGSQLASMQAKLYELEPTERLMDKFDAKVTGLTMGITDPTELAAAQQLCVGPRGGYVARLCVRGPLRSAPASSA